MSLYELSPAALDDLQFIQDFIAVDNAEAAEQLIDKFFQDFEHLAAWPKTGHARTDLTSKNVRFWAVGAYLLVYREYSEAFRSLPFSMVQGMCLLSLTQDNHSLASGKPPPLKRARI
jgi:plasmid stabilization system protein ParE